MRRRNVNTKENENNIENKTKKKLNIDKRKLVSLIISLLLFVASVATIVTVGIVGILPFKYMIALVLGLLVLNVVYGVILLKKKKGKKEG